MVLSNEGRAFVWGDVPAVLSGRPLGAAPLHVPLPQAVLQPEAWAHLCVVPEVTSAAVEAAPGAPAAPAAPPAYGLLGVTTRRRVALFSYGAPGLSR